MNALDSRNLSPPRRLLLIVASCALLLWGAWWHLVASGLNYPDFRRFYYAIRGWREGASLYDPSLATWLLLPSGEGMHLWNLNPPHVSLLFWPLTFLPIEPATTVWTGLTVACLVSSVRLVQNALGLRLRGAFLTLLIVFVVAGTPTISYAATGNVTGPLTLLCTWTWVQWREGRGLRMSVGLATAWSAKLFLLPLVGYLLLKRRWREAALSLALGFGFFALGLTIFGRLEFWRWLSAISDVQWPWLTGNSSIVAPVMRAAFVSGGASMTAPGMKLAAQWGALFAVAIGLSGTIVGGLDRDADRGFLLVLLSCLLASPLGWLYYWWIFAGPLAACLRVTTIRRAFWLSLPGWIVPVFLLWPYENVRFAVTLGSLYTWSLLVLWSGTLISAMQSRVGQSDIDADRRRTRETAAST